MMGIIGKKTENELNVTSSDLNYELWTMNMNAFIFVVWIEL